MTVAFANANCSTFSLVSDEVLSPPCSWHPVLSPSTPKFVSPCFRAAWDCSPVNPWCQRRQKTRLALRAAMDERGLQCAGALLLKPSCSRSFHPSAVPVGTMWLHFKWGNWSILREKWEERKDATTIFNTFCWLGHWLCWQPNTYARYVKGSLCFYARTRRKHLCFLPRGTECPTGRAADMQ